MRHRKHRNKLGLNRPHRLAVVRNLATQLLQYEKIITTLARAKALSSQVDKLVTLAKKKDLASRRKILAFVKNKIAVKKLYEEYLVIYQERHSGFTRIYKLKPRLGDNALMVLISMVDRENIVKEENKPVDEKSTLKQVKKDLENTANEDIPPDKIKDTKENIESDKLQKLNTTKPGSIVNKSSKNQASKATKIISNKAKNVKLIQNTTSKRDNRTSKG